MSDIYKINTDSTIYRNSYIVAMLLGKIIVEEERNKKIEFENEKDIIDEMFNLPFEKAIKQLLDRKIISYEELEKISKESVSNYFWIKKATDLEITSRIQKKLVKSLENGETYRQFKKNLNIDEMGLGTNGSYWEGAFRTNIAIAQAKGQLDAQIEGIEYGYKYGLFDAILDGRETHTCHDLDGKVMLLEKWIEKGLYPPLHYRCRSRIIALDEEDVKAMGLTVEQDVKGHSQGNFGRFSDSVEKLKNLVKEKEEKVKKLSEEILQKDKNGGIIFVESKTIKEANKFAIEVLGVNADYKGIDIRCANEWNKGLFEMRQLYPEIAEKIKFVGSIQGRNNAIKKEIQKYYEEEISELFANPQKHMEYIKEKSKEKTAEFMKLFKINDGTMAQSLSVSEKVASYGNDYMIASKYNGITMNNKYFNDYDYVVKDKKEQVEAKWKPIGADSVKGTFDHEFGHQIDAYLNLESDTIIKDVYEELEYTGSFKNKLSGYARTNIKETIAEAWSEYRNNPNPREIALKIGKRVEELWKIKMRK